VIHVFNTVKETNSYYKVEEKDYLYNKYKFQWSNLSNKSYEGLDNVYYLEDKFKRLEIEKKKDGYFYISLSKINIFHTNYKKYEKLTFEQVKEILSKELEEKIIHKIFEYYLKIIYIILMLINIILAPLFLTKYKKEEIKEGFKYLNILLISKLNKKFYQAEEARDQMLIIDIIILVILIIN